MKNETDIRRVVVVVLDGLRPDAVELFDLHHLQRLFASGAGTLAGSTVAPSVTTAAMTSLLTGVSPTVHGIVSDRIAIPRSTTHLFPVPDVLARNGYPSSAFMADVSPMLRGIAGRIGRGFGFGSLRLCGRSASDILLAARTTLRTQRRGLILLHWPDADRAGHAHGWMSDAYADACDGLDHCMGLLLSMLSLESDPHTLLIALADHGGGGVVATEHAGPHMLDSTIPIVFAGGSVEPALLPRARLLDVAPTILRSLGIEPPVSYEGRVIREALVHEGPGAAVA